MAILAINEGEYIFGKNEGKMVSIFFPKDCNLNCTFCTTKDYYKNINIEKVEQVLINISNSDIEEIVFTGGEPLNNLELLEKFINIVKDKKVYINTCFTSNVNKAIELFNKYDCVLGVNISRHSVKDVRFKNEISKINCNVRINIVNYIISDIPEYIKNWSNVKKDLELTFREDYRFVNNLYDFQTETLLYLTDHYQMYSQIYCHVCNKFIFKTNTGLIIRYHRGLQNTRLKIGNIIEIQEFVLFPDGTLCTDWDKTDYGLLEIAEYLNLDLI